jgi:cysteine-rich repeat protein
LGVGLLLSACSDDGVDPSTVTGLPVTTESDGSSGSSGDATSTPTTGDTEAPSTGEPMPSCGDGIKDPGELCDDGDVDNTDYCLGTCMLATCGDAFVQAGIEQCDDGNNSDEDSCVAGCYLPTCGDGHTYAGVEGCDDGNKQDGDGCDAECEIETQMCGDGIVEGDEACDDANADDSDDCLANCVAATCGDGYLHAALETCDDGNPDDTDDCTSLCQIAICGDGLVHKGDEECDDANDIDTDACLTGCKNAVCGDAVVQAGVEVCDDGKNIGEYGGCGKGCAALAPRCGDAVLDEGVETCDDANLVDGDGCSSACQLELPPECLGYVELKEPDRAASFNDGPGKVTKCDKTAEGKWHRFLDPAGVVMPLVAPSQYSCGTDSPGYMLGTYPFEDEGIVPRTVCFPWFNDPCMWSHEIAVRNCGEYFVFQLPTPSTCALRYCAAPL